MFTLYWKSSPGKISQKDIHFQRIQDWFQKDKIAISGKLWLSRKWKGDHCERSVAKIWKLRNLKRSTRERYFDTFPPGKGFEIWPREECHNPFLRNLKLIQIRFWLSCLGKIANFHKPQITFSIALDLKRTDIAIFCSYCQTSNSPWVFEAVQAVIYMQIHGANSVSLDPTWDSDALLENH